MRVHGNAGWLPRLALGMTLTAAVAACGASGSGGGGAAATSAAPAASAASSGGSSSSPVPATGSAAAAPDPCQVVTAAEASQLAGKPLTQVRDAHLSSAARTCVYTGGGVVVTVTTAAWSGVSTGQVQAYYNEAVQKFSGEPGVTLSHPGIGDRSLAGSASFGGIGETALAFTKGNVYVSILATTQVSMTAMKAAATTALGRV